MGLERREEGSGQESVGGEGRTGHCENLGRWEATGVSFVRGRT